MPKVNDELFFTMTMMFIDNIIKNYDLQEMTEETKLNYLRNVVQYCERHYDQTYEGNHQGSRRLAAFDRLKRRET